MRRSLEIALKEIGYQVDIMRSDNEFEKSNPSSYDFIILDPWTWAAPGDKTYSS